VSVQELYGISFELLLLGYSLQTSGDIHDQLSPSMDKEGTLPALWMEDNLNREDRMSSQTKPDVGNVIWTDTTHVSPLNVRTAREIQAGDRVFDRSGVEWDVIEVRRERVSGSGAWAELTNDIYAPSVRWITVRLRQVRDAANEGEVACTSSEKFLLSVDGVVTG
jgi:hypothetical protein